LRFRFSLDSRRRPEAGARAPQRDPLRVFSSCASCPSCPSCSARSAPSAHGSVAVAVGEL
jgi:hypothetical protein